MQSFPDLKVPQSGPCFCWIRVPFLRRQHTRVLDFVNVTGGPERRSLSDVMILRILQTTAPLDCQYRK